MDFPSTRDVFRELSVDESPKKSSAVNMEVSGRSAVLDGREGVDHIFNSLCECVQGQVLSSDLPGLLQDVLDGMYVMDGGEPENCLKDVYFNNVPNHNLIIEWAFGNVEEDDADAAQKLLKYCKKKLDAFIEANRVRLGITSKTQKHADSTEDSDDNAVSAHTEGAVVNGMAATGLVGP